MAGQQPPQKQDSLEKYSMPIAWDIPQDTFIPSATHIVVQRDGQDFIVNIFELRPPLVYGTDKEKVAQLKKMDAIHAKCIARFIIGSDRLPEFIKALTDAQELPSQRFINKEEAGAND